MIHLRFGPGCRAARFRSLSTNAIEEYSKEPRYPEIKDLSYRGRKLEKVKEMQNEIQNLGTAEEKMIKINMPRYYGWKCHIVKEGVISYDNLPLTQHITRTHLVQGLPAIYNSNEAEQAATQLVEEMKPDFLETLAFEWNREVDTDKDARPWEVEAVKSPRILESLNSFLMSRLAKQCPHLRDVISDPKPRLEASWFAGGIEMEHRVRKSLEFLKFDEFLDWPRDRIFQYLGSPVLQVRAKHPLLPVLSSEESCNKDLEVPAYSLDPRTRGKFTDRRYLTNIPGFWPGDKNQFGAISYHTRQHHLTPEYTVSFPEEERVEALHSQAILASFAWLHAQACNLGFTTFNDITYPLVSQTIISNAQTWSFYTYQMNTLALHCENTSTNPKRNVCWSSKPMNLFESVNKSEVLGFNGDVLKTLVKFYLNKPQERENVNLTPYLDAEAPVVSEIEDRDRREFLEMTYKKLNLNGQKPRPDPEYWDWEKIYKIKFQTRPMDPRRRPFELWQNPWQTTIDEGTVPVYVPKKLRENPKDRRQKYKKTYYP